MSNPIGDAVLTVECPGCGNRMKHAVAYLQSSPELQCSECHSMLKIDGEHLRLAMEQVDAAINALTDGGVRIVGS